MKFICFVKNDYKPYFENKCYSFMSRSFDLKLKNKFLPQHWCHSLKVDDKNDITI